MASERWQGGYESNMSKENKGRWNPAEQKPRVWRIVVKRLWTLTHINILLLLDMKKTSESTNYASRKDWNGMSRRNFLPVLRPQNVQWEIGVPRLEQHQQHIATAHLALKTSRHMFTSGWWFQPLWKILVNGKDYLIYYEIKHVWNHQPDMFLRWKITWPPQTRDPKIHSANMWLTRQPLWLQSSHSHQRPCKMLHLMGQKSKAGGWSNKTRVL